MLDFYCFKSYYNCLCYSCLDGELLEFRGKKIFWEENSSNSVNVPYDGTPFIIIGKQRRECFHGPDRNVGKKKRESNKKKVYEHYICI